MEHVSKVIDRLMIDILKEKNNLDLKKENLLEIIFRDYSSRPQSLDGCPVEIEELFSCLDFYGRQILMYKYGLVDGKERSDDQIAYFFSTVDDRSDRNIDWVQKIEQRAIASIRLAFPDTDKNSPIS